MEYSFAILRRVNFKLLITLCVSGIIISCSQQEPDYTSELMRLKEETQNAFSTDIAEFNGYEGRPESDGPYNSSNNEAFLQENIPMFTCSNKDFTAVYNYRWWMMSKHFRRWTDPEENKDYWIITEFFGWPAHGSISGAISCPAGHQFYDLRWFRDPQYLESYIDFYMKGYASRHNQRKGGNFHSYIERPESHHFSSWMVDGTEAFLKIHPDNSWRDSLLPYMEKHQQVWDEKFMVSKNGAHTDGLYKVLDLYDGMEFTISAALPLIESDGPYAIYTNEDWKKYYLGWGSINDLRGSDHVKKYSKAFANAYPLVYLVRPSINSYYYANLKSLATLYGLKAEESGNQSDYDKSSTYLERSKALQQKALSVLWNEEDQFFYSFTAADNEYGIKDKASRVRESVGYTPWYFNMIPKNETKYDAAWEMLFSDKGFNNVKGMTTAEIQHPLYNEQSYAWNGRGWPFQNSVVNKAYANYLKNYKSQITVPDKERLYMLIEKLVAMHGKERNIGEWYIPSNGEEFGGVKDYFHSTFPDMLIEDLLGFTSSHKNEFSINSLLPEDKWDYFYLGNLCYHDHDVDIIWKKDWNPDIEGNQSKLCVWIDNQLVSKSDSLNEKLTVTLN
ncbi:MGH1-like glycoside hydrolase domain-containing protein [Sunxiuqinia sp. A32]|uniref:MGH1-like glycoside hydrolase domain-containing protein n=1 Tax=Sunxiuqinia sp. A32 TaxID=3461496 RepID=UPI0040464DEF